MALKNSANNDKYLSILSDGTIRISVPEGTEGAIKREYETSDGKVGVKHELVYTEVSGMITKVAFFDGEYGKLLQLTIVDGDEEPLVLSVSTASNYGEDLMKKLPNVDLNKPVVLVPYSFEDEKGKKRKGVTVRQDEVKIENYYYDAETKKNIHGYPAFPKKKMTTEDWKLFFLQARIFLTEQIVKIFKIEEKQTSEGDIDPDKEFENI